MLQPSPLRLLSSLLVGLLAAALAWGQEPQRATRPQQGAETKATPDLERRLALVIGNAAYREAPLRNPVNDARAIAKALQGCGFQVQLLENATRDRMVQGLREFGTGLQGGGVGLFYFAGHGMQVKGRNFLIPVDANIAGEDEVAYSALDAEAVLSKMETAGNRLNLVILDACRNNPFGRSFRSGSQGLAQMDAPAGSYLAYATAPGRTAADGTGSNGLYTRHLLTNLTVPGLKVEDLFKRVRNGVMEDSRGAQIPWESSSLRGDFYFAGGGEGTAVSPEAVELGFWNSLKDSTSAAEFEAYLAKYPTGAYADLARRRLQALQAAKDAAPKAFLGLRVEPLSPAQAAALGLKEGLQVTEVISGSPAAQGGVQVGDLLVKLDGTALRTPDQFLELIRPRSPGDTLVLFARRRQTPLVLRLTLAPRPSGVK